MGARAGDVLESSDRGCTSSAVYVSRHLPYNPELCHMRFRATKYCEAPLIKQCKAPATVVAAHPSMCDLI